MPLNADDLTNVVVERLRKNVASVRIEVVASFCDVKEQTAAGWLANRRPLGGLVTLKLWHLLAEAGIDSPELKQAERDYALGVYIGRLLAFDIMSMEEACNLGGVKDGAILSAVRTEGRLMHPSKTLDELIGEYGELLEMAREDLRKSLPDASPIVERQEQVPASSPVIVSNAGDSLERKQLVFTVSERLAAAHVAATLAIEEFTSEERDQLRRLTGERTIFGLQYAASRLCSERAYNEGGGL